MGCAWRGVCFAGSALSGSSINNPVAGLRHPLPVLSQGSLALGPSVTFSRDLRKVKNQATGLPGAKVFQMERIAEIMAEAKQNKTKPL